MSKTHPLTRTSYQRVLGIRIGLRTLLGASSALRRLIAVYFRRRRSCGTCIRVQYVASSGPAGWCGDSHGRQQPNSIAGRRYPSRQSASEPGRTRFVRGIDVHLDCYWRGRGIVRTVTDAGLAAGPVAQPRRRCARAGWVVWHRSSGLHIEDGPGLPIIMNVSTRRSSVCVYLHQSLPSAVIVYLVCQDSESEQTIPQPPLPWVSIIIDSRDYHIR